MKIKDKSVEFTGNPSSRFTAGQLITGHVILTVLKEAFISAIEIRFKGVEKTSMGHFNKRVYSGSWPVGEVVHFDKEWNIYQSADGTHTIAPGTYRFPFSFQLPAHIPPTYRSIGGSTSYTAQVTIQRPDRFLPSYIEKDIIVEKKLPSSANLVNLEQFSSNNFSVSRTVPGVFGRNGEVDIECEFNKTIFVPGETVMITTRITNNSCKEIKGVSFEIEKNRNFHSHAFAQMDAQNGGVRVMKKSFEMDIPQGAGAEKTYELPIPEDLHPSFRSSLLNVDYRLRVNIKMEGLFAPVVHHEQAVFVGKIEEEEATEDQVPGSSEVSMAPIVEEVPDLPTYEEAEEEGLPSYDEALVKMEDN